MNIYKIGHNEYLCEIILSDNRKVVRVTTIYGSWVAYAKDHINISCSLQSELYVRVDAEHYLSTYLKTMVQNECI